MSRDYITLLGSEEVSRAGHNMSHAADVMRSAAGTFDDSVRQMGFKLDDFLIQFTQLVERMEAAVKKEDNTLVASTLQLGQKETGVR